MGADGPKEASRIVVEATPRVELGIGLLQSPALPLGYVAATARFSARHARSLPARASAAGVPLQYKATCRCHIARIRGARRIACAKTDGAEADLAAIALRLDSTLTNDGENRAFEALFRSEYGKVVAIARRVLFDAHAAEDIAQDVFVTFHRLHPPQAPYAARWLHVAAAHAALNELRGRKRRRHREMADAIAAAPAVTQSLDPAAAIADKEVRDRVLVALTRIGKRHATALALRNAGLSYAEVGAALAVNPNQVGTLLRRAELALKKELEDGSSR
jgi:RNA polymerase sigma factor (sigma-70 family)